MRIVVGLGGNALLEKGEPVTVESQRQNVRLAARALSAIAPRHELVVTHGNGPQVGLLALQSEAYGRKENVESFPLDVLGAQTEGMIGYLIEQELSTLLPDREIATILTMVEVDANDPAFEHPTKPIGPVYDKKQARKIEKKHGFPFARDGKGWRRVVPSPAPRRIAELRPIEWLLERGVIVVCAGGGGIPIVSDEGELRGVEAVIDKDRASALLAQELEADLLVLATDVEAIFERWGEADQRPLRRTTVSELRRMRFDEGSMGPKVDAACSFVTKTGGRAAIGAIEDLEGIVRGKTGTTVEAS